MHRRLWFALVPLAALSLAACSSSACQTNGDCASRGPRFVCANEACVLDTPQDSGTADSGISDSGTSDSGTTDSGTADSGTADSGTADSGTADSGTADSGTADSGTPDSGTADAGAACSADWQCASPTAVCDPAEHVCVACTSANASACSEAQTCANDTCVAADAGGSSDDLAVVIAYAVDGGTTTGLSLGVNGALVTYLKPLVGTGDVSGFFVQARQSGPALLVQSNPGAVAVGDRVRFTVTDVTTRGQLPVASQIANLSVLESGHDVHALASDVSLVDFTQSANVTSYAGRLITLEATLADGGIPANAGYDQAPIVSLGVPSVSSAFGFYAPTTVFSDLGLRKGCHLDLENGILWRYFAKAEPSAWNDGDLIVSGCPTLRVTGASALDPTHVGVTFNVALNPSTVSASAFPISGLTVSNATVDVSGTSVTLTTASQTPGKSYALTVSSSVTGNDGEPLAQNTASFNGYSSLDAQLRLVEVNPNIANTSGGDRLALFALTGGKVDALQVRELVGNTLLANFPAGMTVAAGDVIVVHLDSTSASCTEVSSTFDCPAWSEGTTYDDNAWDVVGSSTLAYSSKVVAVLQSDGGTYDAVPFTRPGITAPAAFSPTVASLETDGLWKPTGAGVCTSDAGCQADSVDWTGLSNDGSDSVQHVASFGAPPDDRTAWFSGTATWGVFDGGTSVTDAGVSDGGILHVAEWNLEWFGDTQNGPTNDDLQQANVTSVMADAGADLWSVEEVVDTARFANVVSALPGGYQAVLAKDYDFSGDYTGTQQVGVVYRTDEATFNSARIILGSDSYYFAGRPPLEVSLTVRGKLLYVIALHMKAYDDSTSRNRREQAAIALKSYLDTYHPNDRVMVLGDWNDDIDESIALDSNGNPLPSPYANFVSDPADYTFATSPLTAANTSTTATNFGNGPIDHHLITNELTGSLVSGSATVLHPNISSYSSTTTDHYPTVVTYQW